MLWNGKWIYSRNCYLRPPLGAAKTSLKQQVVFKTRVAMTCPCKVNSFLLLEFKKKGILRTVAMHCTCIHWYLTYLWFKVYTKGGSKFTQAYNKVYCGPILQVNGSVHAKSGGHWSHSTGSRSPQRLFCTKSSVHRISVIKTRWSLTTEVISSSFYCIQYCNTGVGNG